MAVKFAIVMGLEASPPAFPLFHILLKILLFKTTFNIIPQSIHRSHKRFPPLRLLDPDTMSIFPLRATCHANHQQSTYSLRHQQTKGTLQFTNVLFAILRAPNGLLFMYLKYRVLFEFCKDILNTKHYTGSGLDQLYSGAIME